MDCLHAFTEEVTVEMNLHVLAYAFTNNINSLRFQLFQKALSSPIQCTPPQHWHETMSRLQKYPFSFEILISAVRSCYLQNGIPQTDNLDSWIIQNLGILNYTDIVYEGPTHVDQLCTLSVPRYLVCPCCNGIV